MSKHIKPSKSPGLDGIPTVLFGTTGSYLPLHIPNLLLLSYLAPLFRHNGRSQLLFQNTNSFSPGPTSSVSTNYTPVLCRLMEDHAKEHLVHFLITQNLINPPAGSFLTNLSLWLFGPNYPECGFSPLVAHNQFRHIKSVWSRFTLSDPGQNWDFWNKRSTLIFAVILPLRWHPGCSYYRLLFPSLCYYQWGYLG